MAFQIDPTKTDALGYPLIGAPEYFAGGGSWTGTAPNPNNAQQQTPMYNFNLGMGTNYGAQLQDTQNSLMRGFVPNG